MKYYRAAAILILFLLSSGKAFAQATPQAPNALGSASALSPTDQVYVCQTIGGCDLTGSHALKQATISQITATVGFTTSVYTSNTTPLTLSSTSNIIEVVRQGTPAAITINLPAAASTNTISCVKDGGNNFAVNLATIKTTDSTQIDGTTGSSGIPMNQARELLCFIFDGTMWDIL